MGNLYNVLVDIFFIQSNGWASLNKPMGSILTIQIKSKQMIGLCLNEFISSYNLVVFLLHKYYVQTIPFVPVKDLVCDSGGVFLIYTSETCTVAFITIMYVLYAWSTSYDKELKFSNTNSPIYTNSIVLCCQLKLPLKLVTIIFVC